MMNFNEIFWMVGECNNKTNWWEIFDSELFEEVCKEIARRTKVHYDNDNVLFNVLYTQVKGFSKWYNELMEDL